MNIHKNARLTPSGRAELARMVLEGRHSIAQVANIFSKHKLKSPASTMILIRVVSVLEHHNRVRRTAPDGRAIAARGR